MKKKVGCCCALAGKTRGAVWVCLDFWAPPFASRQKVEKQHTGKNVTAAWTFEKLRELNIQYNDRLQQLVARLRVTTMLKI